MKTLIGIFLICVSLFSFADDNRTKLIEVASSQIGVKERTGHNDGKQVEKYLRATGLGKGNAWCAAFITWCHEQANIPNPKSAYCPDWFKSNVVYERNALNIWVYTFKKGQVFGLYFEAKRRVAHVGILEGETKFSYETIEGNTDADGSREGDGVYKKIRNKRSIYIISDYCMSRQEKNLYLGKHRKIILKDAD